jgi:peptidoglycan hydrolase CwlO-like protein
MKPGATLADCANKERRLKRLKESRDTLQAHIAQLQDKIEIIEHEIREATA